MARLREGSGPAHQLQAESLLVFNELQLFPELKRDWRLAGV